MHISWSNKSGINWQKVHGYNTGAYSYDRRRKRQNDHGGEDRQVRIAQNLQDIEECAALLCTIKGSRSKKRKRWFQVFRCKNSGNRGGGLPPQNEDDSQKSRIIARADRIQVQHPPRITTDMLRKGLDRARLESGFTSYNDLASEKNTKRKNTGIYRKVFTIAISVIITFLVFTISVNSKPFDIYDLHIADLGRIQIVSQAHAED